MQFEGNDGTIIPVGTVLTGGNGVQYQTVTEGEIGSGGFGTADAVALTAGTVGNLPDGDALSARHQPIPGVTIATLLGDMTGGVDAGDRRPAPRAHPVPHPEPADGRQPSRLCALGDGGAGRHARVGRGGDRSRHHDGALPDG